MEEQGEVLIPHSLHRKSVRADFGVGVGSGGNVSSTPSMAVHVEFCWDWRVRQDGGTTLNALGEKEEDEFLWASISISALHVLFIWKGSLRPYSKHGCGFWPILSRALHHPVGTAGVAGCVDARSAASYVECGGTVRSRWQTCQSVLLYIKIYLLKLSMKSEKLSMKSEKWECEWWFL